MINAFLSGVNKKKMIITTLVMIVYFFITNMIIHSVLMGGIYKASAQLWRPEMNSSTYMLWMILGQILVAKFFTFIFIKGYQGKGVGEGVRFGLIMWAFTLGGMLIQYTTTPITCEILTWWAAAGLVQYVIAGVLAAKLYKA